MLTIHQMAERTGVTIRALRYYDKIGLLPPGAVSPAGYRLYGPAELERLQQILFFRELEFPLAEIKAILASPAYDRTAALTAQRALLRAKRDRLDGLLRLVEAALKGETTMEMAFTAFDRAEYEEKCRAYAREVKARWGDTAAWRENQERQQSGEETAWGAAQAEAEELIAAFARSRPLPPEHPQVQALTGRWQAPPGTIIAAPGRRWRDWENCTGPTSGSRRTWINGGREPQRRWRRPLRCTVGHRRRMLPPKNNLLHIASARRCGGG